MCTGPSPYVYKPVWISSVFVFDSFIFQTKSDQIYLFLACIFFSTKLYKMNGPYYFLEYETNPKNRKVNMVLEHVLLLVSNILQTRTKWDRVITKHLLSQQEKQKNKLFLYKKLITF